MSPVDGELEALRGRLEGLASRIEELERFQARVDALLAALPMATVYVDRDLRCPIASQGRGRLVASVPPEAGARSLSEVLGVDAFQAVRPHLERMLADGGAEADFEVRLGDEDGGRRLRGRLVPHREGGTLQGAVLVLEDVSDHAGAEIQAREARKVFENAREAIVVADAQGRVLSVNAAFSDITGFQAQEVVGETHWLWSIGREEAPPERVRRALSERGQWQGEVWARRRDGEVFALWQNISAVRDDSGAIVRYVSVFADVSRIKETEERLTRLAHHDPLTGLPNRLLFRDRLEHVLTRAKRHRGRAALLFLDLDEFKEINDRLGHAAGDELLEVVASRLSLLLRDQDTVARLGGDEFTVILDEVQRPEDAALVALKVIGVVAHPVRLGEEEVEVSASVGIAIYPDDAEDARGLLSAADAAMYRAKDAGKNDFQFYSGAPARLSGLPETWGPVSSPQPSGGGAPGEGAGEAPITAEGRPVDPRIADLVPEYFEARKRELVRVRQLLEEGDLAALRTIGHQLKGSGGGYGFPGLTALGAELEAAAAAGSRNDVAEVVAGLEHYLESVRVPGAEGEDQGDGGR